MFKNSFKMILMVSKESLIGSYSQHHPTLNLIFSFRHVHLVMFITFSWIVWIQLACVSPLGTTFARFELIDPVSNQVDSCSLEQILIFFFSFFPKSRLKKQACAPRYVWYSRNFKRREPIGTCYTARNNFNEFFEYSPCRTSKELCQPLTFSLAAFELTKRLLKQGFRIITFSLLWNAHNTYYNLLMILLCNRGISEH